jgi:uncharacterized membrane protein required for colicin V production
MFTMFDTIVVLIMIFSVLMALCRGFIKEFFTILSWIVSTIITIYLSPVVQVYFENIAAGKKALVDAVTVLAIFMLSMLVFSFLFGKIIHFLKKKDVLFLDRSLGVLFGLIRGALFVCLGYIFIIGFIYDKKPEWLKGQTEPVIEMISDKLEKLNPRKMNFNLNKNKKNEKNEKEEEDSSSDEYGYSDKVRTEMEEVLKNELLSQ